MNKILIATLLMVSFSFSPETMVLICLSPTAYSYHKEHCEGLNKCTHEILKVSKKEAKEKYKKTAPCNYCY